MAELSARTESPHQLESTQRHQGRRYSWRLRLSRWNLAPPIESSTQGLYLMLTFIRTSPINTNGDPNPFASTVAAGFSPMSAETLIHYQQQQQARKPKEE